MTPRPKSTAGEGTATPNQLADQQLGGVTPADPPQSPQLDSVASENNTTPNQPEGQQAGSGTRETPPLSTHTTNQSNGVRQNVTPEPPVGSNALVSDRVGGMNPDDDNVGHPDPSELVSPKPENKPPENETALDALQRKAKEQADELMQESIESDIESMRMKAKAKKLQMQMEVLAHLANAIQKGAEAFKF